MPLKFKTDKELLEFVSEEGVSRTHAQGYFWFWHELVPALERAKTLSPVSNEMLSACYYVAGDVHDFNDAPKAALKCYGNALKFDPDHGEAHREIAQMLWRIGRYDEAIIHSDKALSLNPDDRHAMSDREDYTDENRLTPPLNVEGDVLWIAREHLARAKPEKALKTLRKAKGLFALRVKACAFAALEKSTEYLEAWAEIARSSEEIFIEYADFFFMEDRVYEGAEIWATLLSSKAKLTGVFTEYDGLEESERYKSLSVNETIRLRLHYYVCAHSEDKKGLKALFEQFPEWTELREVLQS